MNNLTLESMYEDYVFFNLGARFEKITEDHKYTIWSYFKDVIYQTVDWMGNPSQPVKLTQKVEIQLGKKGSIKVSGVSKSEQNEIITNMKKWVWKNYMNVDL